MHSHRHDAVKFNIKVFSKFITSCDTTFNNANEYNKNYHCIVVQGE